MVGSPTPQNLREGEGTEREERKDGRRGVKINQARRPEVGDDGGHRTKGLTDLV